MVFLVWWRYHVTHYRSHFFLFICTSPLFYVAWRVSVLWILCWKLLIIFGYLQIEVLMLIVAILVLYLPLWVILCFMKNLIRNTYWDSAVRCGNYLYVKSLWVFAWPANSITLTMMLWIFLKCANPMFDMSCGCIEMSCLLFTRMSLWWYRLHVFNLYCQTLITS